MANRITTTHKSEKASKKWRKVVKKTVRTKTTLSTASVANAGTKKAAIKSSKAPAMKKSTTGSKASESNVVPNITITKQRRLEKLLDKAIEDLRDRNPFLRKFDKGKQKKGSKRMPEPWTDEQYELANKVAEHITATNAKSYKASGPILHKAGETILKNRGQTTRRAGEEMKRISEFYIALVGKLDPDSVGSIVESHSDSSNIREYKKWVSDYYNQARSGVASYFKQNVYELARLLGGVKKFPDIPRPVRKVLYGYLLDQCPVGVLRHAFAFEYRGMDIESIFASISTERHRRWQAIYRRKFELMCLVVDDKFLGSSEIDMKESGEWVTEAYDHIMSDSKTMALHVGGKDEAPSRGDRVTKGWNTLYVPKELKAQIKGMGI